MRRSARFLDKGLKGWIVKTARKHYWRVAAWMDLDDLVQEGFLAYAICRARYDDRVENRRHFMALVKVVFLNQITDLANERTATPEMAVSQMASEGRDEVSIELLAGTQDGEAEFITFLSQGSAEIRSLLGVLLSPEGQEAMRREYRRRPGGGRETRNERFNRLIGTDGLDLEGELKALLAP